MRVFHIEISIRSTLPGVLKLSFSDVFSKVRMVLTSIFILLTICQFSDLSAKEIDQNSSDIGSKADSLYAARQYSQAVDAYQLALKNIDKVDSTYYNYHLSIVNCYIRLGNLPAVENTLDEIRDGVTSSEYLEIQSLFYYLNGRLEFIKGQNPQLALDNFYESYKIEMDHKFSLNRRASASDRIGIILSDFMNLPDSSFFYLKQALKDETELNGPNHWRVAGIHGIMAHTYIKKGEVRKALSEMKNSLSALLQEADPNIFEDVHFSKGYDSLTDFFELSLKAIKGKDVLLKIHPDDVLNNFLGVANRLLHLGHLDLAEAYCRIAEEPLKSSKRWNGMAGAYGELSVIYQERGQLKYALALNKTAIDYGLKALGKFPRAKVELALRYMNRGSLFEALEVPDSAVYFLEKALELRLNDLNDEPLAIHTLYLNLASVYHSTDEDEKSLQYLNKIKSTNFPYDSELSLLKAEIYEQLNQKDSALYYYRKSVASVLGSNDANYGTYLTNLADFFYQYQLQDSALYYYQKGLIVNTVDNSVPPLSYTYTTNPEDVLHPVTFLKSLIQITNFSNQEFRRTKDKTHLMRAEQAVRLSKAVINTIQRSFIQDVDQIESYTLTRKMIKMSLETAMLLQSENQTQAGFDMAFDMVDLGKSQIILEAVKRRNTDNSSVSEAMKHIGKLKTLIDKERSKLLNARLDSTENSLQSENAVLGAYESELAGILLDLKDSQPTLHNYLTAGNQLSPSKELRVQVRRSNEAIIQYFQTEGKLFALLLSRDKQEITELQLNFKELSSQIDRLKEFTRQRPSGDFKAFSIYIDDAYAVYQQILAPFMTGINADKITIISDGLIQNLPLEALLYEEVIPDNIDFKNLPYLVRTNEINYASSAALLIANRTNHSNKEYGYKAWAPFSDQNDNTRDAQILRDENLTTLPGASKELKALGSAFSGTSFYGTEANEESFKENIGNSQIIHIATHGVISDIDPTYSNLLFGDKVEKDSIEDNRLYMFELYSLRLNADLAVLTACNTGSGKLAQGEGTISLARAFKYAGAKSVLMSLWLANDQSTSDIIGDFYRNLADKQGKGEALRNAKLNYLSQADNLASHPFYWSHLILSGDSSSLRSSKFPGILIWALLIACLGFVVVRYRRNSAKR